MENPAPLLNADSDDSSDTSSEVSDSSDSSDDSTGPSEGTSGVTSSPPLPPPPIVSDEDIDIMGFSSPDPVIVPGPTPTRGDVAAEGGDAAALGPGAAAEGGDAADSVGQGDDGDAAEVADPPTRKRGSSSRGPHSDEDEPAAKERKTI